MVMAWEINRGQDADSGTVLDHHSHGPCRCRTHDHVGIRQSADNLLSDYGARPHRHNRPRLKIAPSDRAHFGKGMISRYNDAQSDFGDLGTRNPMWRLSPGRGHNPDIEGTVQHLGFHLS
ncbi:hypothetical protein BLIN101_02617 [Brevibacterium linens]|uniref:Uncharacterized protein n=1 Tax=Brevibacterium linens TaxID=1703 RepID=A0A2H1JSN6_BRELN|nr:hypothetical protein BLIN101_02617 [Brevibacterium linens]